VAPNAQAAFTFTIQAPSTPGTYNFQWRMVQEGSMWFGAYSPTVVIQVPQPQLVVSVQPTPPAIGTTEVTVLATDSLTYQPVAGTVAINGQAVGSTNTPFIHTFTMTRRRVIEDPTMRPPIYKWVTTYTPTTYTVTAPGYPTATASFGFLSDNE
jgi:hypothetical protein